MSDVFRGPRAGIRRLLGLAWPAGWRTGAATAALLLGLAGSERPARADKVDDAFRKLGELEQRSYALGSEFRETVQVDPNAADRRVVEAETLYSLKNYTDAATVCRDVIEKYPNTRAYDDAVVLLGESLYAEGDLLSARRYFELAIKKNTGSRREQAALQRLVELALKTGDFQGVESWLGRLASIPPAQLEPSVPYVQGKYHFFRDKLDEALAAFQSIPPANPYYLQARYFIATIQVKKGDLAQAATLFDQVIKLQPRTDGEKEIQDLARLAIGRLLYDRGQFDQAKEW